MTSYPGFDLNFLRRVYISTAVAGALIGLMLIAYRPMEAYCFFAGIAFGVANLWGLSKVILALFKVGDINPREAVLTIIIKFPIILVLFFVVLVKFVLAQGQVELVYWYVGGFSLTYVVILLKVLAIIIFNPKPGPSEGSTVAKGPGDGGDSI
jgi:hypothetical protein